MEEKMEFCEGERVLYLDPETEEVYKAEILDVIPPEHYKIKLVDVDNQIVEAHELRLAKHLRDFEAKIAEDDCSGSISPSLAEIHSKLIES